MEESRSVACGAVATGVDGAAVGVLLLLDLALVRLSQMAAVHRCVRPLLCTDRMVIGAQSVRLRLSELSVAYTLGDAVILITQTRVIGGAHFSFGTLPQAACGGPAEYARLGPNGFGIVACRVIVSDQD